MRAFNRLFLLGLGIGLLIGIALVATAYLIFQKDFFTQLPYLPPAQASVVNLSTLPARPIRNLTVPEPEVEVAAGIIYWPKKEKILWSKNTQAVLPIASLTKLITAAVALDSLPPNQLIQISPQAVATEGEVPNFRIGEIVKMQDVLKAMLIGSSNDAAVALAEQLGKQKMVELMNQKAVQWGLTKTHFQEPTGLNPNNRSTAYELARLTYKAFREYPFILKTLQQASYSFISVSGIYHHVNTTNRILASPLIVAGKTGYTEAAGESFSSLIRLPTGQELIIVVLAAQDRFKATLKLIDWIQKAYIWR